MSPIKHRNELTPYLNKEEEFFIEIFEEFQNSEFKPFPSKPK
jgi:hypothetical protein